MRRDEVLEPKYIDRLQSIFFSDDVLTYIITQPSIDRYTALMDRMLVNISDKELNIVGKDNLDYELLKELRNG